MRRNGLASALSVALLLGSVQAQAQTQPRTLNDALASAYSTNPSLQAARAQLRAIDEGVPQALAGWRPTVVLSAGIGYADGTVRAPFQGVDTVSRNNRNLFSSQASLTQPLYRGGGTRALTNQAKNQVFAQRGRLQQFEQQLFTDTISAFVGVIQAQQVLQLNISNEQVLARQLQATNDRFRVGEITRTDVAQAEAALSGARAQRQQSEGNLATSRATYFRTVGEMPDRLVEPQPIKLPIRTQNEASQLASQNNPNVIAALFDDAASRDAVDARFAELLPQLSFQATAARTDNTAVQRTRGIAGQVLLNASVPIYQGGAEYSRVRQARQTAQQTRRTVDDARRGAIQIASQAWENLVTARTTIDSTRAQIRANQIALEGVQREAIVGSRPTLDVLNAEQALLISRVPRGQTLATRVTAPYAVASAIGRLTARDLSLDVALYDETAYYNAVRDRLFGTGDYAVTQPGR